MNASSTLQLTLDDLVADLRHARRRGDLGRLALIAYCEVRRWARQANEMRIASHSAAMITAEPHSSREAFVGQIDELISELEEVQSRFHDDSLAPTADAGRAGDRGTPNG